MDETTLSRIKALLLEIRLALDELEHLPVNVTPLKEDEVELEGIVGRPELKLVKGKQLWTAGLGVKAGDDTQWIDLAGWGSIAHSASSIERGQLVRVVGTPKTQQYIDQNGTLRRKQRLTVSLISTVESASSVTTP